MARFDHLKWVKMPDKPGWWFSWRGLKGMEIRELFASAPGQKQLLGGRWDGGELVPIEEWSESSEARLWAGPLGCDPEKMDPAELFPPELPESEFYILKELKDLEESGAGWSDRGDALPPGLSGR